ncbi:dullard protein [Tritrichomonas foetus]|uniref:Dullard protein n=1 Tax=Tritrichomonas foetus TaxID=1144522 RepID=A0A1J4JGP6_9EUKA|nr:dullard protein [Tritrichomonas foetus]|eukprot:OHS97841.1 dullard protein [Tritrichomonas foetus]
MAIPHSDFSFVLGLDANKLGVYVCIRPGAQEFLLALGELFELVLFTASSQYYADTVVDHIDPQRKIKYRLYRESCTDFSGCFVKDLSKLGRDLRKIIIVDNSSVAYLLHPYNAIGISSWYDDPEDTELIGIQEFLIQNCQTDNVYDILVDKDK